MRIYREWDIRTTRDAKCAGIDRHAKQQGTQARLTSRTRSDSANRRPDDECGRLETITYEDAETESFGYDDCGNLTTYTDQNGTVVTNTYNGTYGARGNTPS